ncbi:MAG TPA: hypothetical protein VND44_09730 [Acidimicrobiales bacterium]|nr:hypothetical protein [Acidimicrobiales bacterium]
MRTALRERHADDTGMTLMELLVTSTILVALLGMVFVSMNLINSVSTSVTSQFQEFDQALPAMAPFHSLLAAEVEPGPTAGDGTPSPGFQSIGNFSMTFYADIGTAYGNTTSCPTGQTCTTGGTTAGPAKIVAQELDGSGHAATACNPASPCSLQLRMYLPVTGVSAPGVSTCPGVGTGPACQWSTDYRLLANVLDVVNDPSAVDGSGAPTDPLFSYTIFDPFLNQAITLTSGQVQNQMLTGLTARGYSYDTQSLSQCDAPNTAAPTVYPVAISCPTDAVQSVSIHLRVAKPGANANTVVENSLVVYRYAPSPGAASAPYQYSAVVG